MTTDVLTSTWRLLGGFLSFHRSDKELAYLKSQYLEPHRIHHHLLSLEDLLQIAALTFVGRLDFKFEEISDDIACVLLALIYHDVIYLPRNPKDNAARGAITAKTSIIRMGGRNYIAERVSDLILGFNKPPSERLQDVFARALYSIDLSVFGLTFKDYVFYSDNLRKEFSHLSDDTYRLKRGKLLAELLQQEKLFEHPKFYELEKRAKRNICRELKHSNFLKLLSIV